MPDVKLRHIYRCFIESVLQCVTGRNTVKSSSAVMTCSTYAIGGECREMILQLYANQQLMSQLHFSICHQMHACVSAAAACSSVQQQQLQNANISEKQRKPQKKLLLNSLALLVWPTVTMRTGYQ